MVDGAEWSRKVKKTRTASVGASAVLKENTVRDFANFRWTSEVDSRVASAVGDDWKLARRDGGDFVDRSHSRVTSWSIISLIDI